MSAITSSYTVKPWLAGHDFICGWRAKSAARPAAMSAPVAGCIVPDSVSFAHIGSSGSNLPYDDSHVLLCTCASLSVSAAAHESPPASTPSPPIR